MSAKIALLRRELNGYKSGGIQEPDIPKHKVTRRPDSTLSRLSGTKEDAKTMPRKGTRDSFPTKLQAIISNTPSKNDLKSFDPTGDTKMQVIF